MNKQKPNSKPNSDYVGFAEFEIDDPSTTFSSPPATDTNKDPFDECIDIIYSFTTFLRESAPPRTTMHHRLYDGRSIQLYLDKNGSLFYNWRPAKGPFCKPRRLS